MNGLWRQERYLAQNRQQKFTQRLPILLCILGLAIATVRNPANSLYWLSLLMIGTVMSLNNIAYEEATGWQRQALVLPVRLREVVGVKFLFFATTLLGSAAMIAVLKGLSYLVGFGGREIVLLGLINVWLMVLVILLAGGTELLVYYHAGLAPAFRLMIISRTLAILVTQVAIAKSPYPLSELVRFPWVLLGFTVLAGIYYYTCYHYACRRLAQSAL